MVVHTMHIPTVLASVECGDDYTKNFLLSAASHACIFWNELVASSVRSRGLIVVQHSTLDSLRRYNAGDEGCHIYFAPLEDLKEKKLYKQLFTWVDDYNLDEHFAFTELILPKPMTKEVKCMSFLTPLNEKALFGNMGQARYAHMFDKRAFFSKMPNLCPCGERSNPEVNCQKCKRQLYCSQKCKDVDEMQHSETCTPPERISNDCNESVADLISATVTSSEVRRLARSIVKD